MLLSEIVARASDADEITHFHDGTVQKMRSTVMSSGDSERGCVSSQHAWPETIQFTVKT